MLKHLKNKLVKKNNKKNKNKKKLLIRALVICSIFGVVYNGPLLLYYLCPSVPNLKSLIYAKAAEKTTQKAATVSKQAYRENVAKAIAVADKQNAAGSGLTNVLIVVTVSVGIAGLALYTKRHPGVLYYNW